MLPSSHQVVLCSSHVDTCSKWMISSQHVLVMLFWMDSLLIALAQCMKSHLAKSISSTISAVSKPQPSSSPHLHLSVAMSPGRSTYGAVQVFQSSTINTSMPVVQPDSQKKEPQKNGVSSKCPLIAAYISGAQFSALVYHNSTATNVPTQDRNQETVGCQVVLKASSTSPTSWLVFEFSSEQDW